MKTSLLPSHSNQFTLPFSLQTAHYVVVKKISREKPGVIHEIFSQEDCDKYANNLKNLNAKYGRFSEKTGFMLAIQAIKEIQKLHDMGYVHRDIKPENFVLSPDNTTLTLIDFGTSKHLPKSFPKKPPTFHPSPSASSQTNLLYMSINVHLGLDPSKRDDLISLGYMLLHLLTGKLPWSDFKGELSQRTSLTYQSKANISIGELCEGFPQGMVLFFEHLFKLGAKETPHYEFLIELFEEMMKEEGYCYELGFEWNLKKKGKGIDLEAIRVNSPPLCVYEKKHADFDEAVEDE